ncbi:uncharacterized protein SOCE26_079130 [Sorangium cellulosum]|jgi:hypothetical protein|uniref:Uncharacterized protein n=1 Tax=Sorangium cellulosum TaxID=56 RepID=A0A2L0F4E7_SORCE|nr:uncharacterized protein SOCE26_079130 [Sorangium cellulosum]
MQSGGGLVSAGLAWWWGTSHTQAAENYPGNKYLRTAVAEYDPLDRNVAEMDLNSVEHRWTAPGSAKQ